MHTLYTMDGCVRCFKAKKHLENEHIPFQEINILQSPQAISDVQELIGEVYVPVLVTNDQIRKGSDILTYTEH